MNQIKVELLDNKHDDLFVVNAARVSFNVWKEKFDAKDQSLLNYLAREKHTSPFRHVRMAFMVPESRTLNAFLDTLTPFHNAGLVRHYCEGMSNDGIGAVVLKHSIFGWANLIKSMKLSQLEDYAQPICKLLHERCGASAVALGIPKGKDIATSAPVLHVWEQEIGVLAKVNPWLIDTSFRCKVPIWLSRQLVKHQVSLSWNEVSRRYVSSPVELFDQEFRCTPEDGIKQGSGEIFDPEEVPVLYGLDTGYGVSIHTIMEKLLIWYDDCIKAGIAPETVRGYMPLNMMTEYIWSGSLPAFAHMYNLRHEGHAQKEAQDFASKLGAICAEAYPEHWEKLTCG